MAQKLNELSSEVAAKAEWTQFNDEIVEWVGTWEELVAQCVEFSCYPTVLFFERRSAQLIHDTLKYKSCVALREDQIHSLFRKALRAHDLSGGGDQGGFSQQDIFEQMELMKQF